MKKTKIIKYIKNEIQEWQRFLTDIETGKLTPKQIEDVFKIIFRK